MPLVYAATTLVRPAAVVGLLMTVLLTGCGGGADSPEGAASDPEVTRLTTAQAAAALLSEENLGDGFTPSADEEDLEDSDMGCLSAVEDLESADAPVDEDKNYEAVNEISLPLISTAVSSYDTVADASETFDLALAAFKGCSRVKETDEEGTTIELEIEVNSDQSSSDADEQFNIIATGSISSGSFDVPFGLWASAVRIDNHVTLIAYSDIDAGAGAAAVDDYTAAAVGRLRDVLNGDEPSDALVATGTPG